MNTEVKVNWIKSVPLKEQAQSIRETLKREFPNRKFSVRIERFAGGGAVNVEPTDIDYANSAPTPELRSELRDLDIEIVRQTLWAYVTQVQRENVCGDEGWGHLKFPVMEEDGSITPTYYAYPVTYRGHVLNIYAGREVK